jgi:hypothetical protein
MAARLYYQKSSYNTVYALFPSTAEERDGNEPQHFMLLSL